MMCGLTGTAPFAERRRGFPGVYGMVGGELSYLLLSCYIRLTVYCGFVACYIRCGWCSTHPIRLVFLAKGSVMKLHTEGSLMIPKSDVKRV